MGFSIISGEEKALLKQIEESNDADVHLWKLSNIGIPLVTILLSLLGFTLFKRAEKSNDFIAYMNLLLNGSIPMIALNRIGAMGIYLFKYDKAKEKEYGIKSTYHLRTKLALWFLFLVIGTVLLYIYQVSRNPFELSWWLLLPLILSVLSVLYSVKVAKDVYLLQETMMDNTFYHSINSSAQEKKTHLNEKYGS